MTVKDNYNFSQQANILSSTLDRWKQKRKKLVLYGYGVVGKMVTNMLNNSLVAVVDKNSENLSFDKEIQLLHPRQLFEYDYDGIIVSVLGREIEIIKQLVEDFDVDASKILTFDLSLHQSSFFLTEHDNEMWEQLKNRYYGKRCFIIGNGPSLNKHDLTLLENEFTFGVNGIFYKTQEMGFTPTFYVVEDNHVVDDNIEVINAYKCKYKLFPSRYRESIKQTEEAAFFNYDLGFYNTHHPFYCKPRFSDDSGKVVYGGQTVTYSNLQIAYHMGFTEVYLIGVDFSYSLPKSTDIQGDTYISNEDDPNHFHADYFGKGKKWHDPKLERVALNFELAKVQYEQNGRIIYNATLGGSLEIFPRKDWFEIVSHQQ